MSEFLNITFPDEMIRSFLTDKKHELRIPYCMTPYVKAGKTFLVRESCAFDENGQLVYTADGKPVPEGIEQWNSPADMPKEAARITLVYESGRIEHLQNITVEGLLEEGLELSVPPICQDKPFTEEQTRKLNQMTEAQRNEYFNTLARHRYMGWCVYNDDLYVKYRRIWNAFAKESIPDATWDKNPNVTVMKVSVML